MKTKQFFGLYKCEFKALVRVAGVAPVAAFLAALAVVSSHAYGDVDSRVEKIVIVGPNDTLNSIAIAEFGSLGMARLLAEYNELASDSPLKPGTEIVVPTHLEPKKNFAVVNFVKGAAYRRVAGSRNTVHQLKAGDQIYTTDLIVTGKNGFVSTELSNGSVVQIQPLSKVTLQMLVCMPEDEACEVSLDSETGSVAADVKKRPKQQNRFRISTPYASAAVRGTVFDFGASATDMLVGVTEGEVEINGGPGSASLPEGYGVVTETGGEPGNLIALLRGPDMVPIPMRFAAEDVLHWDPVEGASTYHVSLSSDASGQQEIYREVGNNASHAVRSLPAGEVYAAVRAVDSNRLKGFTSRQAISIVETDPELPKPELAFDNDDESVFVYAVGSSESTKLEVQFATDADFRELVSVDIPGEGGGAAQAWGDRERYFVRSRVVADENTVGGYGDVLEVVASD